MNLPRLPYRDDKLFGCLFAAVFLVPLVFTLFTSEQFEVPKFVLLLLMCGLGLLAALWQKDRLRTMRGNRWFYVSLALFWLWAVLATLFAWDKNYAFFGFYPRFTSGLVFDTAWVLLILLLGLLDGGQMKFLLKTAAAAAGLVALWGLLQSVGIGFYLGLTTEVFIRAAPSFLGNTDFASMFVVGLLPLTILFFFRANKVYARLYYGISGFLQVLSLFVFASRGALLAAAAGLATGLVLVVWFWRPAVRRWAAPILAGVALLFVIGAGFLHYARPGTWGDFFSTRDVNVSYRLSVWRLAGQSILRRPWLGVGLGNFELMYEHDYQAKPLIVGTFDDAHNLLLQIATTGGLPLLLAFLSLLAAAVAACWSRLRRNAQPEDIALLASLAAWLAAAEFTPVAIPCFVALALLLSAGFQAQSGSFTSGRALKVAGSAAAAALVIYALAFFTGQVLYNQSVLAYANNDFSRAYGFAEAALKFDPSNHVYYVFAAGSAIRLGRPQPVISNLLAHAASFNTRHAYTYIELANLNYLLFYQTKDPVYIGQIFANERLALDRFPYAPGNYFSLAAYDGVFGRYADAELEAKRGLVLQPGNPQSEIFLAKLYQAENKKQEAVAALLAAVKLDPQNFPLYDLLKEFKAAPDIRAVNFPVDLGLGQVN